MRKSQISVYFSWLVLTMGLFGFQGCGSGDGDDPPIFWDPPIQPAECHEMTEAEQGTKGSGGYTGLSYDFSVRRYSSCEELQIDIRSQILLREEGQTLAGVNSNQPNVIRLLPRAAEANVASRNFGGGCTASKSRSNKGSESSRVAPTSQAETSQSSPGTSSNPNNSSGSTSGTVLTNVQELGVDEGDFVKVGDHHVFVYTNHRIEVIDRKTLVDLGFIDVKDFKSVSLYSAKDQMVMLGVKNVKVDEKCSDSEGRFVEDEHLPCEYQRTTFIRVFNAEEAKLPVLAGSNSVPGVYYDSRFAEGNLVLIFADMLPFNIGKSSSSIPSSDEEEPVKVRDGKVLGIACGDIAKPLLRDMDFRLTRVVKMAVSDIAASPKTAAILGGGDDIYVTDRNVFVSKRGSITSQTGQSPVSLVIQNSTAITKVKFAGDEVKIDATGKVNGLVKDHWAFKDVGDEMLSVVTTQNLGCGLHHKLSVLKKDSDSLTVAASVDGFGQRENLRAIRYVDKMAYVVTFGEQYRYVDPLFAIDLSNPLDPRVLGQLEISGFSTYLHSAAPGRVLGLGFDASETNGLVRGIQVSLFDTSNPVDLKRIDVKIIGDAGSYSDAISDHHAFFFDAETRLVGIPAVQFAAQNPETNWAVGRDMTFSGSVIYKANDDALLEVARISHRDLTPQICAPMAAIPANWTDSVFSLDVNRVYKVDGQLLSVSRYGIKTHEIQDGGSGIAQEKAVVRFSEIQGLPDCSTRN